MFTVGYFTTHVLSHYERSLRLFGLYGLLISFRHFSFEDLFTYTSRQRSLRRRKHIDGGSLKCRFTDDHLDPDETRRSGCQLFPLSRLVPD